MENLEEKRSFGRKNICKAVTLEMSMANYGQGECILKPG